MIQEIGFDSCVCNIVSVQFSSPNILATNTSQKGPVPTNSSKTGDASKGVGVVSTAARAEEDASRQAPKQKQTTHHNTSTAKRTYSQKV